MVFKKLEEIGYKRDHYESIGPNDEIHGVILGEEHGNPDLFKDQIEIIDVFKPQVVFHEGFSGNYIRKPDPYFLPKDIEKEKKLRERINDFVKRDNRNFALAYLQDLHQFTMKGIDDDSIKDKTIKNLKKINENVNKLKNDRAIDLINSGTDDLEEYLNHKSSEIKSTLHKAFGSTIENKRDLNLFSKVFSDKIVELMNKEGKKAIEKVEKEHGISKDEIREVLKYELIRKTNDYLKEKRHKRMEKVPIKDTFNAYFESKDQSNIRSMKMLEKILSEDQRFVAIIGETHARDIMNELKKLHKNNKLDKTYLVVKQAEAKGYNGEKLKELIKKHKEKLLKD